MLRKFFVFMLISSFLLTTGCLAVIVGAGAGAGAYAYIDGELARTYQARYDKAFKISKTILKDLKQPILEEKTDGVITTIKTERADGTPMTIKVRIVEPAWTEVSVRTGYLGLWKKEVSQQFHEFIAARLKK